MTPERFQKIKDILIKRQPDLTVVLDNVHKPHNLAAIIRSCDAVGISDIHGISSNEQKVSVNLKSASGSNHWVNLHIHHSIPNVISELKQSGFSIYAANGSTKAIDYRKVDYTKPSVIVLGAELDGISPETLDAVDEVIKIPMQGMVESFVFPLLFGGQGRPRGDTGYRAKNRKIFDNKPYVPIALDKLAEPGLSGFAV